MKNIFSILMFLMSAQVLAVIETYEFETQAQEQLYTEIIHELRCPKCQNQTIAESNAGLSEDLRFIVYQKVMDGESKRSILRYMQERYGDFVLYDPPVKPANYFLWFAPLIVFVIILVIVLAKVGRRKVTPEE
ncbi:cytochrome c-type biogenesis protein [Kangiella sediminilitoris]|uniref:Cytochrome c-type biogenesis protein n=1 Tax=Kangiella sediminilitoris TaxID=1144748 RepID=A0A1B3B9T9_9GAMM|nr:cytochrome c-type biogenesis protein [Kangiella sediminilitoris]AOE49572.1 Cytochrome C biogenesis protein [Kangiella sediminilitoris]